MSSCFGIPRSAVLLLLAGVFFMGHAPAAQQLEQHVPKAALRASPVGQLPGSQRIRLGVGLPLRNTVELTNLLHDLYDPASPSYRRFLTPQEFTARFGPEARDYEAAAEFFHARGFTVKAKHPNRILLNLEGSVGDIEKTLHINLKEYDHPSEARIFFAPDREPWIELNVPVVHISGLDNFIVPRPASLHVRPPTKDQGPVANAGSGPNGTYIGRDFRTAYAPGVALDGSGQYVGLLQFDGYYPSDITAYATRAGLTNVPLINVLIDEVDGTPGKDNIEVALDIEMCMSIAPGLSGIIVYEGLDGNDILNRMANDNLAKQLSASWTYATDVTTETIFQQMIAQGQCYFNASGDGGAYTGTISKPADSPNVVSVGGTTLTMRNFGQAWVSETAWSWFSTGSGTMATAGGVSTVWPIPSWQQGLDMTTNQGSSTMRNIPDVAMVADDVFAIVDNGQTKTVGGTSVSSPLWAAFLALVNQQAAFSGQPPIGFLNNAVYNLGKGPGYASAFHDITTGNNTNTSSPTLYYAVPGYDLCTGWGTPTGRNLINALAPPLSTPSILARTATLVQESCAPGNNAVDPGEIVVVSFALLNVGGVNTTNMTATLLNSNGVVPMSDPQSYGVLASFGPPVARQFTFTADGACGTSFNPVLKLLDSATDLGTVTFNVQLGAPVVVFSESFDSTTAPALPLGWSAQRTSGATNWVTSSALSDSGANSAFAYEPTNAGSCDLTTPITVVSSSSAQLVFRNFFNTEVWPDNTTLAYDGGFMEISINGGPFQEILAAGCSFASGGYTRTIQTTENPLNGHAVWAGLSGGFIDTVINLPASAAGLPVRFKWRFGFDNGNAYGSGGWYIDSVAVRDGYSCCGASTRADLVVSQSVYPNPGRAGQALAYTLTVTNVGPAPAVNVKLTDTLPVNASFLFASTGYTNDGTSLTWNLGLLMKGSGTSKTVLVTPAAEGWLTNTVTLSSDSPDPNPSNNSSTSVAPILAPPTITGQPLNQVAVAGTDVTLSVAAAGSAPLSYQWRFNSSDLPGQTSSTLLLTQVSGGQMGQYTVFITNPAGSVTSLPALVRVLVPAELSPAGLMLAATNTSLSLSSVQGLSYTLEYKNALEDPAWVEVPGSVLGNGSTIVLQDTNASVGSTRFYRVRTE